MTATTAIPRIAFQGERGAFSEEAAVRRLGENIEAVPRPSFEALFSAIAEGAADYALAPIENTLAGSVYRSYDLLLESRLHIVGEVIHPIALHLIGTPHATLDRLATVAAKRAAEIYGGKILLEHIEDHRENYTRFLLLAPQPLSAENSSRANKLSLVIQLPHQPGALHRALAIFARREINLLKIESRPIPGRPWQYCFYLDLQAALHSPDTVAALEALRLSVAEVRLLGSYPAHFTSAP